MEAHFSSDLEGSFKSYEHVEFATTKAAYKTLELNGDSFQNVETMNTSSNTIGATEKHDEGEAIEPQEHLPNEIQNTNLMNTTNFFTYRNELQVKFDFNRELEDDGIQEEQVDQDTRVHQLWLTILEMLTSKVDNFFGSYKSECSQVFEDNMNRQLAKLKWCLKEKEVPTFDKLSWVKYLTMMRNQVAPEDDVDPTIDSAALRQPNGDESQQLLPFSVVAELGPQLCISLGILELIPIQEISETKQKAAMPVASSLQSGESVTMRKDGPSPIKICLRKVKIFTEYVPIQRENKTNREDDGNEGRCYVRSDGEYPLDMDSFVDFKEEKSGEVKIDTKINKSFSYGTWAHVNHVEGSFYFRMEISKDWVWYIHQKPNVSRSNFEDFVAMESELSLLQTSKCNILPLRKKTPNFRSYEVKKEQLLMKAYVEEGEDDIDFACHQLGSDESSGWRKTYKDFSVNRSLIFQFGGDNLPLTVGSN
ncbi:hypothetical protein V6N13_053183 [Hibiscus sabdariffa]